MAEWQKLQHEIYELGKTIKANAMALKTKPMNDQDRDALRRFMVARISEQARLQKRLDRLGLR